MKNIRSDEKKTNNREQSPNDIWGSRLKVYKWNKTKVTREKKQRQESNKLIKESLSGEERKNIKGYSWARQGQFFFVSFFQYSISTTRSPTTADIKRVLVSRDKYYNHEQGCSRWRKNKRCEVKVKCKRQITCCNCIVNINNTRRISWVRNLKRLKNIRHRVESSQDGEKKTTSLMIMANQTKEKEKLSGFHASGKIKVFNDGQDVSFNLTVLGLGHLSWREMRKVIQALRASVLSENWMNRHEEWEKRGKIVHLASSRKRST